MPILVNVLVVWMRPLADTGTYCEVTMGKDCETSIMALFFSLVMMDGLEST